VQTLSQVKKAPRPWTTWLKRAGYRRQRLLIAGVLFVVFVGVAIRSIQGAGYETMLVAEVSVVRAPVTGVAAVLSKDVGDSVTSGEQLGVFAVPIGLTAAMASGSEDVGQLTATLASLDERLAKLKADEGSITGDASQYHKALVKQITARGVELQADTASADSEVALAGDQLDRSHVLFAKGFATKANVESAEQAKLAAIAKRQGVIARQQANTVEEDAARKGLALGNGYSDVQYSTQRLSDLALAQSTLRGERDRVAGQIAAAKALSSGSNPISRTLQFPLRSGVNGRVWSRDTAPGETAREGDAIYTLADCSSFFAYFAVGRRTYSQLSSGLPVTFVANNGGQRWPGRIVNMGLSGANLHRNTNNIAEPTNGDHLVGARITLPAGDQKKCPIGTAGRVVL